MERWKEIDGTNGDYLISDHGNVMSRRANNCKGEHVKIIPCIGNVGYRTLVVRLNNTDKRTRFLVHRLVAEYFCDKKETYEKLEVNHKDADKLNNHHTNLEWVTSSDNTKHAVENELFHPWGNKRKPIKATNIETGEVIIFKSMCDAQTRLGTKHINLVLKGKRSHAKGYKFEYYDGR